MEVVWHSGAEAEEHTLELGVAAEPACWIHTGYASGYVSFCLGAPVYFAELSCRARGDALCVAVGKDRDSWGEEANAIAVHFEAAGDIERAGE